MKINPDTYAELCAALSTTMASIPDAATILTKIATEYTATRARWDLYHATTDSGRFDPRRLYREGLSDSHIDTAIRAWAADNLPAIAAREPGVR